MKLLRLALLLSLPATAVIAHPLVPSETEDFGDFTTRTGSNDRPSRTYIQQDTPTVETHTYYGYPEIGLDTQSAPEVDDLGDLTAERVGSNTRGPVIHYSSKPDTRGVVPMLDAPVYSIEPSAPALETHKQPRKAAPIKTAAAQRAQAKTKPATKTTVTPKVNASRLAVATKSTPEVSRTLSKTTKPASKLDRILNKLNKTGFSIARGFDSFLDKAFGIKI